MRTSLAVLWTIASVGSPALAAAQDLPPAEASVPASPTAGGAGIHRKLVLGLRPSDCPEPLTCAADGECRNECKTDRECISGQTCTTSKVCADEADGTRMTT
ncbi:MAG: hypothetical protein JW940_36360 [Polyangiaceae bacterium]|nr:hypothetical protein [Polyangiaceae bacterium]